MIIGRLFLVTFFCLLLLGVGTIWAQGEKADTAEALESAKDTLQTVRVEVPREPYAMPSVREAIFEHFHNKIVHLPIAFALGGALLLLLALRWRNLEAGGRWLVVLGALSAIITYFTGEAQTEAFEGKPKEWLAEVHEKWGIAAIISFWVWVLFGNWKPLRRYAWVWGVIVVILVLVAAFYGGVVAHG